MPFAMAHLTSILIIIMPILLSATAGASRILAVFPHPSVSQQIVSTHSLDLAFFLICLLLVLLLPAVLCSAAYISHVMIFRSLTIELAQRGHELFVFTLNPINDINLPPRYTQVDLYYLYDFTKKDINFYAKAKLGIWSFMQDMYRINENVTDETLSHPAMQRLISPNSTAKFDLIITSCLLYDAFYALSFRFNAPLITISPILAAQDYTIGNHLLAATSPDSFGGLDDNMNLWQRFVNLYHKLRLIYGHKFIVLPIQERIARKHFGDSVPPAHQLSSRINLVLMTIHPFFAYPCPKIPEILYIGGFHLEHQKKKLPQDLKKILDDAKEGYIYFSLGTNIKSNLLPIERRNMFLKAFAGLPYKVLWKFESDHLMNKPDNVVIRKWLPQQGVLAHPNIRLFIYQGGLHSTDEAIENTVPVIGFPISSDQMFNMKRMKNFKVGKILNIINVNEKELREAIVEMITNSSYKENILKLRDLFRDLPYKPMDNAIWWIEHVIRHKRTPHLRNKSRDIPWYQDQMLDVMAIALGIITLAIYIIIAIIRYIFNRQLSVQTKTKHD